MARVVADFGRIGVFVADASKFWLPLIVTLD